eukprot:g10137.t2
MADEQTARHQPRSERVLRRTCNHCAAIKRKCPGGTPCARCANAGVQCVYSIRQPMGRRPYQHDMIALPTWPTLSVSPATGLSGLAESRFLSCFLQNLAPLCPVVDDKSIRNGLIHAMASQRDNVATSSGHSTNLDSLLRAEGVQHHHHPQVPQLGEEEYKKGQALECALFSSIAIGALMLGCPVSDVARHLQSAQRCREQLGGLEDRSAVSALLLHALSHAFLGAAQQQPAPPGAKSSSSSEAEYRRSIDDASAIDAELPDKDPLATAFMTYRKVVDCTAALTAGMLSSNNPVDAAIGRSPGVAALGVRTEGARLAHERISKGCLTRIFTPTAPNAHPAFVSSDGHFLALRHANSIWEGSAAYIHVHDYLVSELGRLVTEAGAGGAVLAALGSLLIGVKAVTVQTDGLLPLAELVSTQYHQFPGFARYDKCFIAYNALAVFRLLGRREQYTSLRNIMVTRSDNNNGQTPTFDDLAPGVPICSSKFIATSAEMILNLFRTIGARSGGGGGGGGGGRGSGDDPGGGENMATPWMGSFPNPWLR